MRHAVAILVAQVFAVASVAHLGGATNRHADSVKLVVAALVLFGIALAGVLARVTRPGAALPYVAGGALLFAGALGVGGLAHEPGAVIYAISAPVLALVGIARAISGSEGSHRAVLMAGACFVTLWLGIGVYAIAVGAWHSIFMEG